MIRTMLFQMEEVLRTLDATLTTDLCTTGFRILQVHHARKLMRELISDYLGQVEERRSERVSDLYKALSEAMKELKDDYAEVETYRKQDPGEVRSGRDEDKVRDHNQCAGKPDGKSGDEADAGHGDSPGTSGLQGPEGEKDSKE